MDIKATLFDLDGVLIDTEFYYTDFWRRQGEKYFPEINGFEFVIKGQSLKSIYDTYFKNMPNAREQIYLELIEQEKNMIYDYISGAKEFVEDCKNKMLTALVTSSSESKMNNLYRQLPSIKHLFNTIVTAEDITNSKPDAECYLLAAKRLNLKCEECIVFEDSIAGIKAGKSAGMKVVGLATTCTEKELTGKADIIIKNFSNLNINDIFSSLKAKT